MHIGRRTVSIPSDSFNHSSLHWVVVTFSCGYFIFLLYLYSSHEGKKRNSPTLCANSAGVWPTRWTPFLSVLTVIGADVQIPAFNCAQLHAGTANWVCGAQVAFAIHKRGSCPITVGFSRPNLERRGIVRVSPACGTACDQLYSDSCYVLLRFGDKNQTVFNRFS